MTQMTQSLGIPWAPDPRLLGHLGHAKNHDPNDPKHADRVAMLAPACGRRRAQTERGRGQKLVGARRGVGEGPGRAKLGANGPQTKFFLLCRIKALAISAGERMFHSIPFTPRKVQATESRLKAVYDAAKLGLKGDTLALAAGMLPTEYRQLTQLDPVVEMAAQKGKADGEIEMANIMRAAALEGDAKMALEVLKHQHGWVAKQAISVEVDQRISITGALAKAEQRVLDISDAQILETQVNAIDHIQR